jgi:hypothetical protein
MILKANLLLEFDSQYCSQIWAECLYSYLTICIPFCADDSANYLQVSLSPPTPKD